METNDDKSLGDLGPIDYETVAKPDTPVYKMHHSLDQIHSGGMNGEIEEMKKKIESLNRRCEMLKHDFKMYEERIKEDAERKEKMIKREFIKELLMVVDAIDRAINYKHLKNLEYGKENMQLIYNQLLQILDITPILPSPGDRFDDMEHIAIRRVQNKLPNNSVISIVRKGYYLDGDILRPTEVIVSDGLYLSSIKREGYFSKILGFIKFRVLNKLRI